MRKAGQTRCDEFQHIFVSHVFSATALVSMWVFWASRRCTIEPGCLAPAKCGPHTTFLKTVRAGLFKHQYCKVCTTHCAQNPFYMQQCWRWQLGMCTLSLHSMALAVTWDGAPDDSTLIVRSPGLQRCQVRPESQLRSHLNLNAKSGFCCDCSLKD